MNEQRAVSAATPGAAWCRITGGWAVNLDGSDASQTFSLPRVEVRSSAHGWRSECFFADGRRDEFGSPYLGGAAVVMAEALVHARRLIGQADPAVHP